MTVYRQDDPPEVMLKNDRWVDTYEGQSYIYVVTEDVDVSTDTSDLVVPKSMRPGNVDLVFTSIILGNDARYIEVELFDAGSSGTSTLVKTGSGTRSDPFIYKFDLFDDDHSNDVVIGLLNALSDPHLSVSGVDPTNGDVIGITQTALDNDLFNSLKAHTIQVIYDAVPPPLVNLDSLLPESLPQSLVNAFPEALAARLSEMDEGGDLNKARRWRAKEAKAMVYAKRNRHPTSFPMNVRPG